MTSVDGFQLAQANVARLVAPIDSEQLQGFVELLAPVNAIADSAPGFVWRLQDDSGNATAIMFDPDPMIIVNLTVWETPDALWDFVYRSRHMDLLRRRLSWFERHAEPHLVMWWVPTGTIPTLDDARERLASLRASGPMPFAFTFRSQFTPDGVPVPTRVPSGKVPVSTPFATG